ncbi:hypothetical protein [Stackebrandtia soli]|uniref:hypothetical protein n=1 Tax=Stackebrandtia soli TaxID=1892856 RepID=UPI0039EBD8AE
MHHANHFYGHAAILARYCGIGVESPPIRGYLQHGWNIGDGLGPGTPYVHGEPVFVWSDATRLRALRVGRPNVIAIGAPWLYLPGEYASRLHSTETGEAPTWSSFDAPPRRAEAGLDYAPEPFPAPREGERAGTIWYPFHGYEAQEVTGDHRRLIAEIRSVETEPVTVCLYWFEYRDRRIRRLYERAGFDVVCHGYRGFWWRDTDPAFLHRQRETLRRFRRVASNRVSSALFYGVAAGCEPAVYGDPMVLEDEDGEYGGHARICRQWPELLGPAADVATARRIAAVELGVDHVVSPPELTELFGWSLMDERAGAADPHDRTVKELA